MNQPEMLVCLLVASLVSVVTTLAVAWLPYLKENRKRKADYGRVVDEWKRMYGL